MKLEELINKKAELQIAPLIDVVFLLLIYFMVTAALIKKEADLNFQLPIESPPVVGDILPIEALIEVRESGDIMMEGLVYDQNSLISKLMSLKEAAESTGSDFIVNIMPDDAALHGRIIMVMDACAAADVKNMSFSMM